jgi:hypothetical protein
MDSKLRQADTLGMTVAHRLDAALSARHNPVTRGQYRNLCRVLGISDDTLRRYRHGETRIPVEVLLRMVDFYRETGDGGFAFEVLGLTSQWWITPKGEVIPTSNLDLRARTHNGLLGVAGDAMAAARRNLGWVSVILSEGTATVEYHERGLSIKSVRALKPLILGAASVRRLVNLPERTVKVGAELPHDAFRSLEQVVSFNGLPAPQAWRVERMRLETAEHRVAKQLARLAASGNDLVASAEKAGILPECSVFRVDGEDVTTLQIGSASPLPSDVKATFLARNVMARPDTRYGELIRAHVLEARGGPTYYELDGTIMGKPAHYRRPIFPGGNGLYLTHTDKVA